MKPRPYFFDRRIHNLGNVGPGGALHALMAPLATWAITQSAYGGVEPREWLWRMLPASAHVVDLGCGTGTSTPVGGLGVDTSPAMVRLARAYRCSEAREGRATRFAVGNAETYGDDDAFDVATVAFVLHEMPREARLASIRNAMRVATSAVHIMDIAPSYVPRAMMLSGEPYLPCYLSHVEDDVREATDGRLVVRTDVVPEHVVCWTVVLEAS
jgi:SAM-dependent methyltransferase